MNHLLPLLSQAPIKTEESLAQAAKRIVAYRAYRDALAKREGRH